MSKQADQEKQQAEFLTSSEGHQSLLTEQEASLPELVELGGEQLMEITGGVIPTREQVTTALKHVGIAAAWGAGLGAIGAPDPTQGAQLGAKIGAAVAATGAASVYTIRKCIDCYHDRTQPQASAQVRPVVGDVELGHAQHHG
jgi:hypothetical protein